VPTVTYDTVGSLSHDKLHGAVVKVFGKKRGHVIACGNPYSVVSAGGGKWSVIRSDTGKVKGTSKNRATALRQFKLLEGVERGWHPTKK
jgi:hypothetical protein